MDKKLEKTLDQERCICYDVAYSKIVGLVQKYKITSLEQLKKYVDCTDACGMCVEDIQKIIEFYKK